MFLLPSDQWEIKKTTNKGRGVFATKDIEAGTVIGDYLGKIIRVDDEEKYEKKYGFYTMYYHDRASIFPDVKKPGIHIINHSCTPNCYMFTYKGHTLYFALRRIFAGEEITVSYLINPLDEDCSPCTHGCKCDSDICINTMHTPEKFYDKWKELDDQHMKGIKLPRVTYGAELQPLASYPKKIEDHPIYPLYGSTKKPALPITDRKIPSATRVRNTLRQSGQELYFVNVGITLQGIVDNNIIAKPASS